MKPLRHWILVADGANARFLHFIDKKRWATTVDRQIFTAHADPSRKIGSDRPGRTFDSHGKGRHAIEPKVDLHEEKEKQFLASMVRKLEEAFEANAFDSVYVVAPPRALGIIRQLMPERLRARVSGETAGDYTRYDDREISRLVSESLKEVGTVHR